MKQLSVEQEAEERQRQARLAEEGTNEGFAEEKAEEEGEGQEGEGDEVTVSYPAWRLALRTMVDNQLFQVWESLFETRGADGLSL